MTSSTIESQTPPKWIDNDRVDSGAMLSAYLGTVRPDDELYGLTLRVHHMKDYGIPILLPPAVTAVACTRPSCFRCRVHQGGYEFRWFHTSWKDAYLRARSCKDAWTPDETAEEAIRLDDAFQVQRTAHQARMRGKNGGF